LFNLMLAVLLFWAVLLIGETGLRPIVGPIAQGTLAETAEFEEGEEIVAVNKQATANWNEAMEMIFSSALEGQGSVDVSVKTRDEISATRILTIPKELRSEPEQLFEKLGLRPWVPVIKPVIGKVLAGKAAEQAGLKTGDLIVSADGEAIQTWMQWVKYVQTHAGVLIKLSVERQGVLLHLEITPEKVFEQGETLGKIGAGVDVPEDLLKSLQVTHSLALWPALTKAFSRTLFYSSATLKMMAKMLIGQASVKNLSGPISIAQFAGLSADQGFVEFLSFLAKVSISLGVLNLLPIPVLDGGHLLFYAIEAVKGSPVSEKVQILLQQVGIFLLVSLMVLAMFLDIERLFQ
ncbi:MAG: RIP metalloprotease RseP, partial [Gammaproteobacteria bacterium HGW-Gammaproteobacteria-10]